MNRPYVIYLMTTSIDGKINGDFLKNPRCNDTIEFYYKKNREYKGLEPNSSKNADKYNRATAFLCGRVTMQGSFTGFDLPDLSSFGGQHFERIDCVANSSAEFYAVAVDIHGKLNWKNSEISDWDIGYDKCHIVEILCENVSDEYIAFLRDKGISYIFAGENELDLPLAMEKLKENFGIERLLLEGGGVIGGKFAKENMIDELSFIIAPVIEGGNSQNVFADEFTADTIRDFKLVDSEILDNGSVWVRYVKAN